MQNWIPGKSATGKHWTSVIGPLVWTRRYGDSDHVVPCDREHQFSDPDFETFAASPLLVSHLIQENQSLHDDQVMERFLESCLMRSEAISCLKFCSLCFIFVWLFSLQGVWSRILRRVHLWPTSWSTPSSSRPTVKMWHSDSSWPLWYRSSKKWVSEPKPSRSFHLFIYLLFLF